MIDLLVTYILLDYIGCICLLSNLPPLMLYVLICGHFKKFLPLLLSNMTSTGDISETLCVGSIVINAMRLSYEEVILI